MLDNLTSRERLMVSGMLVFLVIAGVFFAFGRMVEMREKVVKRVDKHRRDLQKMTRIGNAIRSLPPAKSLPDGPSMVSKLSTLARKYNLENPSIKDRVEKGRDIEKIKVDIVFYGVQLDSVIKLLHELEYRSGLNAYVGKLLIRRTISRKEIYDVTITMVSERPREVEKKKRGK